MDITPVLNESSNQIENLQNLSDDCHDKESFKGAFGWVQIFQKAIVPFIVRVINGERIKFVSVQMVEKDANIQKYLNFFRPDILRSAIVKFQFMTHTEAKLFNEINIDHYDNHYRKFSAKDCIIRYEDLSEFYEFIKFCYETLYHNIIPNEKYGFIQIDSNSVIPYIIIDGIKYTPLVFFETYGIVLQTIKITDWNFSFIKFCRKIQGIVESLYSGDSCDVVSIDYIKRHFLTESSFEEFKLDYTEHILPLINNEPVNALFNDHIEQRPGIVPATENTTPHTSTTRVIPHNMSVITNGQEMIEKQMGLSEIQQGSNKINHLLKVPKLSSPLPSTSTALTRLRTTKSSSTNSPLIDLTSPPSSPGPSNQQVMVYHINTDMQSKRKFGQTLHDTSQNSGSKGLSEIQQGSNKINHLLKVPKLSSFGLLEKNQGVKRKQNSTLHHQRLPSPPPAIPIVNTQSNSRYIVTLGLSEIQHSSNTINNIVNVPILSSPSPSTSTALSGLRTRKSSSINSEMIELMSPSTPTPNNHSSPTLSTQSKIVYYLMELNNEFEERLFGTSRNNAYKIYEAIFYGKKLRCINREPNSYKNLMVNLEYLVRVHFPMCSVERCARILSNQFKIAIVTANNDQLALLFIQKKNVLESSAAKLMVSLEDINSVFIQLKSLIIMNQ
ncbi:hypothetical protein AGLY_016789 [Aphis glycines]|uniref:Uncharacterized protein n=2 Tax=Aphis glycines TaxID=307491 RepID=A0A6G0SYU2_APHGL|nr:hypothetical protein AGLY_016789 [Aphis glycines]